MNQRKADKNKMRKTLDYMKEKKEKFVQKMRGRKEKDIPPVDPQVLRDRLSSGMRNYQTHAYKEVEQDITVAMNWVNQNKDNPYIFYDDIKEAENAYNNAKTLFDTRMTNLRRHGVQPTDDELRPYMEASGTLLRQIQAAADAVYPKPPAYQT